MKKEEFNASLNTPDVPDGLSPYLTALWHEKRGEWSKAHEIVQEMNDANAAWIHAYLHRKEGNKGNAAYWYSRADKQFPTCSSDQEWSEIVGALL